MAAILSKPPLSVAQFTYVVLHLASLLPCLPTTVWMPHTALQRSFQNIVISCPSLSQISPMTSHLTQTNPNPSHGFVRTYMIWFPFYFSGLIFSHCSPCSLYSCYTGLLYALAKHPTVPKPLQSLQPPWHMTFPHISSWFPVLLFSGPCSKVTSLKGSSLTTLCKIATSLQHSFESLYFCLWHLSPLDMLFICLCLSPPLPSPTRNGSLTKPGILFCSPLYPHTQDSRWSINIHLMNELKYLINVGLQL